MTIVDELRRDESRVLDRLVDGELSQLERRELLAALDDEPGAWRRCALAFLEAQSWRWQLGRMAAEPIVALASAPERAGQLTRASRAGAWLALAAGLLVAFALGTQVRTSGEQQVAAGKTEANGAAIPEAMPEAVAASEPELDNSTLDPDSPAAETESESPWETLTLARADDAATADSKEAFKVSVRDLDAGDADLTELAGADGSTLSAALLDTLEKEGWKITRERHLVPVDLSDGRRMIVPVEQVDFRYPDSVNF